MPAFYRSSVEVFLSTTDTSLTGALSLAYAADGFEHQRTSQTLAWAQDLARLRVAMQELIAHKPQCACWEILLEFNIPRKMKRLDVVLLASSAIIVLEQKSHPATSDDYLQVEEYGLLLHYFHAPSTNRKIFCFVVSPRASPTENSARQQELPFLDTAAYWMAPVRGTSWERLPVELAAVPSGEAESAIDAIAWDNGEYRPVPTIIEAALALRSGLDIREIAHSRAARHDVDELSSFIYEKVIAAQKQRQFVICFVTGVPNRDLRPQRSSRR